MKGLNPVKVRDERLVGYLLFVCAFPVAFLSWWIVRWVRAQPPLLAMFLIGILFAGFVWVM